MAYCRKCGKQIPEDSEYCTECGAKIIEDEKPKRRWGMLLIILGVIVFICVGVIAIITIWKEETPVDLANLPAPFVIDGVYDVETVFILSGDEASDSIALADITSMFQSESKGSIEPLIRLDEEFAVTESLYNLVIIGNPCDNHAIEAFFGITCENWNSKQGEGIIKLIKNGKNKVALLVAGTTVDDTRRAAKAIANYKDYPLSGTECTIRGSTLYDINVKC